MNPLILTCAHLSKAVYEMDRCAWLDVIATKQICSEDTDTAGMAYETANKLFIVFAGSESRRDWLNDFKVIKKDCFRWFRAHKGFSECAESVLDQCRRIAGAGEKEIVVTGHSLGGAVALLVAIGLQSSMQLRGRRISVITFGQPRVAKRGDIEGAFRGDYLRVVNGSDAVPRHPWLGYSHAGQLIYLNNGHGYSVNPGMWERFIDRLLHWQRDRATDHAMSGYIRNLQRFVACAG